MFKSSAGIKWYQIPEYNWQLGMIQLYFSRKTLFLSQYHYPTSRKRCAAPFSASLLSKRENLSVWSCLRATGFIPTSADTSPVSLCIPVGLHSCREWCPTTVQCHVSERLHPIQKQQGLIMPHRCCFSTPCAMWYHLQFICATYTTQVIRVLLRIRHSSTGEQTDDLALNTTVFYF